MAGKGKAAAGLKSARKTIPDGRAKNGGSRANSGRMSKAAMMGLKALLDECWTEEARKECILRLAQKASEGEMEAVKLLMNYTFGRPKEVHEHSGPEGGPVTVEAGAKVAALLARLIAIRERGADAVTG